MNKDITTNIDELLKDFDGDVDLLLFFATWMKNNRNATKAYQELHPNVTYGSAEVLGSRMLSKVRKSTLLAAYGLDDVAYITQLKEGLAAQKVNEFDGTLFPDHIARKPYHDKLGKILGFEKDKAFIEVNQQNNYLTMEAFVAELHRRRNENKK